jgi:hypothetical protein
MPDNQPGGRVCYYDKESKKRVHVDCPFNFLLLDDERFSVTGWDEETRTSYFSNEAKSAKEVLKVRGRSGGQTNIEVVEGSWENIKDKGNFRYTKHLYIAVENDGQLEICMMRVTGAFFAAYVDFVKKNKRYEIKFSVSDREKKKKGKTIFFAPVLKALPVGEDESEVAMELDKQLQAYFKDRAGSKPQEAPPSDELDMVEEESGDEGFEASDEEVPF